MYRIYLCAGPHCTAAGRDRVRAALIAALWEAGITKVEILASGCQDQCAYGPNLRIYPGGAQHSQLDPERIRAIVQQDLQR